MDRRIETRPWTRRKVSLALLVLALAGGASALLIRLSTPRMKVERDKLMISTVRRGPFQEYVVLVGEARSGPAGPEVRALADRYEAARLAAGQAGETEIAGRRQALEVSALTPAADGRVEVALRPRGETALAPGQALRVRLPLGRLAEALLLDRGAFFSATGGQWVWRLDEAGRTATRCRVRLGRQNPEVHEVLSGLAPGDRVITSTYDHLEGAQELVLTH
jgi:hypothetical protein